MLNRIIHLGLVLFLVVAPLAGASLAGAEETEEAGYREYAGRIHEIGDQRLVVDNRTGHKLSFRRLPNTKVSGAKAAWDELERRDWVTVFWKFDDQPPKAHRIEVLPPREGGR
jgi:hypothetical protein